MPTQEGISLGGEIFESRAERATREPIFYFTTKETNPENNETYDKRWVSVLGVELEIYDVEREGGEGTNFREEEFYDFFLDDKAKDILRFLATSVKLRHAPLIEGETDIGKTKAIEYLAFLTNHKLVRISMRGTTDPSEFFGKHVPESVTSQQKILDVLARKPGLTREVRKIIEGAQESGRLLSLEDLRELSSMNIDSIKGIEEEALAILKKAANEGRGLTREEWIILGGIEGIDLEERMFRWQDGEIVKAMIGNNGKGYWIYQDEIGAAEPQILVAKNRILEQYGRIELSEDSGRMVEAGPHFCDFSTTNPPEYAGRTPLAPDFLRRWAYKKESSLSEKDLRERFAFISRELPFKEEIKGLLGDILIAFYLSLRGSIKDILKSQRQKFNYEFSDLVRVRDYLQSFGREDLLAALNQAMEYAFFNKIGDSKKREDQRKNFETLLSTKKFAEKVKEIEEESPSSPIGRVLGKALVGNKSIIDNF